MGFSQAQRFEPHDIDPSIRLHRLALDIGIEFGIGVVLSPDSSLPLRGYWTIKVGEGKYVHGVNTPAAIAFLDGLAEGAREANRIADVRLAQRIAGQ